MRRGTFAGGATVLAIGLALFFIGLVDIATNGFFFLVGIIIALGGLVPTMIGAFGREVGYHEIR